jgi:dihydroorotase
MRLSMPQPPNLADDTNEYWIRGVTLWNADCVSAGVDLRVLEGRVAEVRGSDRATGLCLIPSGVDTQAHLRVPGQTHKETPESALLAAFLGGYGAVLSMPNTRPVIDKPEVLELAQKAVAPFEECWGMRVLFSAAITEGQQGKKIAELEELAQAGAQAFTDDGLGVSDDRLMSEAFARLEPLDLPLLQHAETPGHGGVLAPGPIQKMLKVSPYPERPEVEMIARDIRLLLKTPSTRYHVLHLSARDSLEEIRRAKEIGLRVTAEVTPHHLKYHHGDIDPNNTSFKMNPPLRSAKDRQALIEALGSGLIDWMATDHAPHEQTAKSGGWNQASFGTTAHEAALRALLELWRGGYLTSERLVQVFSSEPAKFLGLSQQDGWGAIQIGCPLRAVLIDPAALPRPISRADLHSLSSNSVFFGCPLPGALLWQVTPRGIFRIHSNPIGDQERWTFLRATRTGNTASSTSAR